MPGERAAFVAPSLRRQHPDLWQETQRAGLVKEALSSDDWRRYLIEEKSRNAAQSQTEAVGEEKSKPSMLLGVQYQENFNKKQDQ